MAALVQHAHTHTHTHQPEPEPVAYVSACLFYIPVLWTFIILLWIEFFVSLIFSLHLLLLPTCSRTHRGSRGATIVIWHIQFEFEHREMNSAHVCARGEQTTNVCYHFDVAELIRTFGFRVSRGEKIFLFHNMYSKWLWNMDHSPSDK